MHRREFLWGIGGSLALSSAGVGVGAGAGDGSSSSIGAGVDAGAGVENGATHPGPYRPLGSVSIENAKETVPGPDGDFAYVATTDGFAVVDVQVPSDPETVAEEQDLLGDRETGPLRQIQDVKVAGDRLVLAGPANPLQGDVLQGFVLYDVSDPANPEQVGFHETEFPIHNCFVSNGLVYLTGNNGRANPLVIVDVSDDDPTEVGRWSLVDRNERWAEVAPPLRTLHDVWVQDGRAYLAHWDAGTYILDVSDPTDPAFVSRVGGRPLDELAEVPNEEARAQVLTLPGNAHYAKTDEEGTLLVINKEAWTVEGEGRPGGIELWDISDVENPTNLTTIEAPQTADSSISGTWTTSHNFDLVDGRLFSSWYQGGVKIHDVSDPVNPEELAWWRNPDETSFWTAMLAKPDVFVASSMGRQSNGKGALYTFPNHAGQQKDAPSLTATETEDSGGTTTEMTTTETTETTETAATDMAETTTEQAALGDGTTAEADSAAGGAPGFGIPAAIAAVAALLGVSAWQTLRE